jgi:hypothetical protein
MEDPQVIKEIDRLIDSYNWETLVEKPDRQIYSLKMGFRSRRPWFFEALTFKTINLQAEIALIELLLQLFKHPRITHKGWILESIAYTLYTHPSHRRDPFWLRKCDLMQKLVPFLRQYANHHDPLYRRAVIRACANSPYPPDQRVNWLLDALDKEHSFSNIREIFVQLWILVQVSQRVRPETHQRLMHQLERLLKSSRLEVRLQAAELYLYIRQRQVPDYVLSVIIEGWSSLDAYKVNHFHAVEEFDLWVYKVGPTKALEFATILLKQSRQFIVGVIIWEEISRNYFGTCSEQRRLVFSREQKFFLEAVLACKALWPTREVRMPDHHSADYEFHPYIYGLETTRAGLAQQLKRAVIVDQDVFSLPNPGEGLPLHIDEDLLWWIEK